MQAKSISSGEISATGQVFTGLGALTGLTVYAPSNDTTVIVYDSTAASGKILWQKVVLTASGGYDKDWTFPPEFTNGIYVSLTGTNGTAIFEKASP